MTFKPRPKKWNWRLFLTEEEREVIRQGDAAMKAARKANRDRAKITNRAIQRAKYAASKP